jgi:hypothetical protein
MSEPMHPSIVQAMAAVMAGIEAVKKSGWNDHGKYKFATTDDVYAATIRLMADNLLVCLPMEEMCKVKRFDAPLKEKGSVVRDKDGNVVMTQVQWVHARYSFLWSTPQGTWTHPKAKRTIFIQVSGPQTFAAIESYLQKQYLRGVFKLPTGDMDLDASAQDDTEDTFAPVDLAAKRKSSSSAKKDGTTERFNEIKNAIAAANSIDMLRQVSILFMREWAEMPIGWNRLLNDDYQAKEEALAARESA